MSAASAQAVTSYHTSTKKAARRSPANWLKGQPRPATTRTRPQDDRPNIVRFPSTVDQGTKSPPSAETELIRKARRVSASWSEAERERRRMQAVRKQEELLLFLACIELEDAIRMAVAAGEQPVALPEIDVLRN